MCTNTKAFSLLLTIMLLITPIGTALADDGTPPTPAPITDVETPLENGGGTPPALPQNAVVLATNCDPKAGVCSTLFQSVVTGSATEGELAASLTTNLYTCGVDVIRQGDGAWLGRLQQNVYGSWGWGQPSQWKLDSGNLSTSAALGYWWASLNGPNPNVPWGTITPYEHVASSAWLLPVAGMHWVDAYFQWNGGYSCTGG